jgi:histidinol-phosphate aminotransferase
VAEPTELRASFARALGAKAFSSVSELSGQRYDTVVDAAGYAGSLSEAVSVMRRQGQILVLAISRRAVEVTTGSCLVVLDEAYRSYVAPELRPSTVRLVTRYPNLLAQRTFSKSYALAGARIGYGFGSREVIEALKQIKPPFNVGSISLAAARAALDSGAWRDYTVDLVCRERERFERTLVTLGIEHYPSQANFVTVRFDDLDRLQRALAGAGLSVRDGADLGMPGWVRISVGTPAVMAELRAILEEIV